MEYSGRASYLHLSLSAPGICGLGFLSVFVIHLIVNVYTDPFHLGLIIASIPALGLGLALFSYSLVRGARMKTLHADDLGIRFSVGERTEWEIPWKGVLLLLSFRIPSEMDGPETYGIEILAGGKAYSVSEGWDIGPESRLREAFRPLAAEALRRGIPVNDKCGWAAGPVLEDEYRKGQVFPRPELEGRWHTIRGLFDSTEAISRRGAWMITIIATLTAAAVIWTLWASSSWLPASVIVPAASAGFLLAVRLGQKSILHGLRIGDENLSLRHYAGEDIDIPWTQVREVRLVRIAGLSLMSIALSDGRERSGVFQEHVCEALQGRYAARRFGRPEAG